MASDMPDPRFHFIDLVVRPLRGNQKGEELARGELMDRLAHGKPAAGDDTLEVAITRLEAKPSRPARRAGIVIGGLCLLLLVLVPVIRAGYEELVRLNPHYHFLGHAIRHQREFENRLTAGLGPAERLFLLANTRSVESSEVAEWQDSFDKQLPGDPGWLEEAILTSEASDPLVRERLDQLGASLDPDNGLWDLLEFQHSKRNKPFLEAFAKPRIESHLPARTKMRLEMLGPPVTLADQVERNHFLFRQRSWGNFASVPGIVHYLTHSRGPEEWLKPEEWLEMTERWATVGFRLPLWGDGGTEYRKLVELRAVIPVLQRQARDHALWREEERMKRVAAVLSPLTGPPTPSRRLSSHASSITRHRADFALPGTFTAEEFTPGRLAEHAVFDRYMALSGALLFALFAVLAAFEGWRRLPAPRGLAAGVLPIFRPVDIAWLGAFGIILPLLWHVGVTRFTPLGCRHLGLMEWDMMPAVQQAGGSFLFSACMILQTARWRAAKRMGFLGFRAPRLWAGWCIAAMAALFVPVMGMVIWMPRRQEEFLVLGSAMAGMPLLWLIWRSAMTAMQPQEASSEGVLLARVVIPVYTAAAGVLLALTLCLSAEEKKWVARDSLGGPATDGSLMQAVDVRAIQKIRADLQQAWR